MTETHHLELAKEALAIAESDDARVAAYQRAAEHIAAHIEDTGDTQKAVAGKLQLTGQTLKAAEMRVVALLRWRKAGYPDGTTPFTMPDASGSKPTDRAALSHARKVARENPAAIADAIMDAPPDARAKALGALAARGRSRRNAGRGFRRSRRLPPPLPKPQRGTVWTAIHSYLADARYGLLRALDEMKDQGPPPADIKAGIERQIDRLEASCEVTRAHLENPDGMIDAIEDFLAEAAEESSDRKDH